MGRVIGVATSFWGVVWVSLFVVALMNMIEFDFSETKAFMLLQRLQAKESLKTEAVGMLAAAFRLK